MSKFILLNCIKEHGDTYGMIINVDRIISLDYKGMVLNNTEHSWWLTYESEERGVRRCVVMGDSVRLLPLLNGVVKKC